MRLRLRTNNSKEEAPPPSPPLHAQAEHLKAIPSPYSPFYRPEYSALLLLLARRKGCGRRALAAAPCNADEEPSG